MNISIAKRYEKQLQFAIKCYMDFKLDNSCMFLCLICHVIFNLFTYHINKCFKIENKRTCRYIRHYRHFSILLIYQYPLRTYFFQKRETPLSTRPCNIAEIILHISREIDVKQFKYGTWYIFFISIKTSFYIFLKC